jgi:hypothetical protein
MSLWRRFAVVVFGLFNCFVSCIDCVVVTKKQTMMNYDLEAM